ncbi:MAG: hypothetical protein CMJ17_00655 [Phenylobacterium sp.]|nr:hypothetical protein [Phenylobacterium sp.]
MAIGEHGEEITITMEEAMAKVRGTRDWMLEVYVDFFQSKPLVWADLSETEQTELIAYRQALLDWPATLQDIYGDVPPNSYAKHQPSQPSWFADKHPRGVMFP